MAIEEDPPAGIPEWVVTFGDMMSLLLTFFILLVSMSEIKKNDKFQGVADSIQQHFGFDSSTDSLVPGDSRPRNSSVAALALTGRSKRKNLLEGGVKDRGAKGDQPRVKMIRPGDRTTIGTVIHFAEDASELSDDNRDDLRAIGDTLRGKPQKIEVRGHTSRRPPTPGQNVQDNWDLAYQRARHTLQFLVSELKIDPQRIRLSVAGPYEPLHISADPQKLKENPRVEVFLLEEVASDLAGSTSERELRDGE